MKALIANQGYATAYRFLNTSKAKTLVMCCVKMNLNLFCFVFFA